MMEASGTKKRRVSPECKIIRMETESNDLCGFAMYCDHFAEAAIFGPFYQRQVGVNIQYMAALGCVPLVFDLKTEGAGMHGLQVMQRTPSAPGGRVFNIKGMVVMTPLGSDDELIRTWFDATFIPALRRVGQIEEQNVPTLQDPSEWRREDCFSKVLLDKGWSYIVRNIGDLKEPRMSPEQFFKADRANYTAIYPAGHAPAQFLAYYHMTPDDVYAADIPNLPPQADDGN